MVTLQACVDQITSWSVTGIVTNESLDDSRGVLPGSALPALLLSLSGTGGIGFHADTFGGDATMWMAVTHYLLVDGLGRGSQIGVQGDMVTHIDSYLAAVKLDATLDGNLLVPMRLELQSVSPTSVGGVLYRAATFRLLWQVVY